MDKQELRHADFRRVDLNLLVAFDAMMEERHVGKAAARVFLGQPAMSYALARLREALDDELFFRSGNKMEPTTLALELAPHVRAWLEEARSFLFARDEFSLANVKATIKVATVAGLESVLLPPLIADLAMNAPGIRIWTKQLQRDEILAALDAEEIDIAIGPGVTSLREWHCSESVGQSPFYCAYSPEQLALPEKITVDVLAALDHVALSWRGNVGSEIDQFFEARGLRRNIAVSAVSELAIMRLLTQFPMVSLQSSFTQALFSEHTGVVVRAVSEPTMLMDFLLFWHRRNDKQLAHVYVRKLIKELMLSEAANAVR